MPKKPDPEMQAFQADLLEAVRDMKARRAARATQVQVTDAAGARAGRPVAVPIRHAAGRIGAHAPELGTGPQPALGRGADPDPRGDGCSAGAARRGVNAAVGYTAAP